MSLSSSKGVLETRSRSKTPAALPNGSTTGPVGNAQASRKPGKLKSHNRSLSHNKLNKLSTSVHSRPNLNRSKSTDGLIRTKPSMKKNTRSYTKLSTLQPLTKTMSNQSIKSSKSTGSLKGLTNQTNIGLKSSGRKGKAILRFNDDVDNDEYEDLDDSTIDNLPEESEPNSHVNESSLYHQINNIINVPSENPNYFDDGRSDSNVSNMQNTSENTSQEQILDSSQVSENSSSSQLVINANPSINDARKLDRENIGNGAKLNVKQTHSNISNTLNKESASEDSFENTNTSTTTENTQSTIKQNNISSIKGEPGASLTENETSNGLPNSTRSSTDDLISSNMYGGSLLLSQSTGLTKKINPKLPFTAANSVSIPRTQSSLDSGNSESISGISFKANRFDQVAEPITTNKTVIPNNSYQTNQTIFNNLQRTGTQYLPAKPKSSSSNSQSTVNSGVNNFSNFLTANQDTSSNHGSSQNIETRTQQRLWLQRENSLLDVANVDSKNFSNLSLNNLMFAHNQSRTNMRDYFSNKPGSGLTPVTPGNQTSIQNAVTPKNNNAANTPTTPGGGANMNGLLMMVQNSAQTSIQSRTEFERTNREYLNVRRHLNPIGESLNRLEKCQNKDLQVSKTRSKVNASSSLLSHTHNAYSNSFKEFSPLYQEKEQDGQTTLQKIWQDAIFTSQNLAPTAPRPNGGSKQPSNQYLNQNSGRGNGSANPVNSLRSPASHTPTTRAVKLAQGESQFLNSKKQEVHI